ncbi:MAG: 5,10-methylenetetrahydrofolate reductase [Chloroflexi bacterium RBG_19FT_COMBO_62_14]|nr:MAG: 5,10-methylenetetrahydrofolate reductase [Chloroflexi bacterium RBG_19FT_COMBO_62_14]
MKSGSRLERVLRSGRFAVTAELNPPDTADPQAVYDRALVLASVCDAINATDASGANVHMSSVGMCALLTRAGYEPVMQVSCRDRNRIAIQGDLLGAAAMGVRNLLCLTGDGVQAGDQPESKPVFDLDSISLLRTARVLRDEGRFLSGRQLEAAPKFFLGAAANPFAPPLEFRPLRLAKKVEAGADFIQTQFCFDMKLMRRYMEAVRELGLHERVFILAGVGPLRSAKTAEWLRSRVPGVVIPDEVIHRLRRVPLEKQREEGKRLCIEIIQELQEIDGVSGVHVMAYRQEELVAEIIEESGLLPRRRSGRMPQALETEDASN